MVGTLSNCIFSNKIFFHACSVQILKTNLKIETKKKKRERMIEYYLRFVEQRFNDRIDGNAKRLNGSW